MRKIFLDIGAYNGISADFFRQNHPQGNEFEIFSFECDERNIAILKNRPELNINLIEKAAWIYDGGVKYYYGTDDGGTLYSTKATGHINPNNFIIVPTINLAQFILANFKKDDYIIVKMNCEGAEYDLIPHLKSHFLIDWIDKWYIQWHYHKIGLTPLEHNRVCYMIPEWHPWDCQVNSDKFIDTFLKSL